MPRKKFVWQNMREVKVGLFQFCPRSGTKFSNLNESQQQNSQTLSLSTRKMHGPVTVRSF